MTTNTPAPEQDPAGGAMWSILGLGTAIGIPLLFAVTLAISRWDGISWGGSAAIAGWGAVVGGPFFGAMVFLSERVGQLSHAD